MLSDHSTRTGYLLVWAYAMMINKYSTLFNDTAMCGSDVIM